MRWAIAISVALHLAALALVFKTPGVEERKYPSAMIVRLASPPPARGVPNPPPAQKTVEPAKPQPKKQKVEQVTKDTRVAEVNPKKKPKKPEQPKPVPTTTREEPSAQDIRDAKSKGLPQGVDLGSEFGGARLDAMGFDSPYYLNILFNKIRNAWDNPFEGDNKIQCTIYFVVSREGKVVDSAIETSSGIVAYDQAALRAVLASKPPPLPNQFDSEELGIHLEFQYIPYQ